MIGKSYFMVIIHTHARTSYRRDISQLLKSAGFLICRLCADQHPEAGRVTGHVPAPIQRSAWVWIVTIYAIFYRREHHDPKICIWHPI